ncbi:MAG: response regulator [Deltaproteobacteria bacterium]|nr:response regulator [Deltaproteobacteria bacterium]RLB34017.1 MAG: hypothetical protein DRH20_12625 [Deltaproteobacteria bacterium]
MGTFENLATLHVLFVDDDHLLRRAMAWYFEKKVSAFVALESAEEALGRLKTEIFDVVICDYSLPGMDGLRFFEMTEGSGAGFTRILITAFSTKTLEKETEKRKIILVRKPFDAKEIERVLAGA